MKVWRFDTGHLVGGSSPGHANDGEGGILHTRFFRSRILRTAFIELEDFLFHHLDRTAV